MDDKNWENVKLIMEKIKPFIAISILIWLVISAIGLWNHNKLQKEVKESCGYKMNEKVYCICDKDFVSSRPSPGNPYFNGSNDLNDFPKLNLPQN